MRPGRSIGILYVGIAMAEFEGMLAQAMQTMAIAAGIAALLVMLLTMLIVRRITKPLTSVTASLTAIADGKSDVAIDCEDRHDEIGEIARTVAVFKNNSLERQRMRSEQAAAAAAAAAEQRKAELRHFVDDFQTGVGGIIDKVHELLRRVRAHRPPAHRDRAHHRRAVRRVRQRLGDRVRARPHRGGRLRRAVELDLRRSPAASRNPTASPPRPSARPRPPTSA